MLTIIYRYCPAENSKARPPFYSKEVCLGSLLMAMRRVDGAKLLFVSDGVPDRLIASALEVHPVHTLDGVGNSQSFRFALELAANLAPSEVVYLVEDDYLHLSASLEKLLECFEELDPSYATLYDHPVRYGIHENVEADFKVPNSEVRISRSHHWRQVESTCMTFAARAGTLMRDRDMIERYIRGSVPKDRELFRNLQGLGGLNGDHASRLLLGPIPSLATHCDLKWLAPAVNWADVAKDVA